MPMNPRLLRPLASGVHPEAAAWRTAVVGQGGSVSASTMRAVSKFCADIDKAQIRDRFYRLNLFAGTGLNACIVPLYRGQSRTGTQYGGTVDQSLGSPSFGEGDYSLASGLQGNGSSKYLNTGFAANTVAASSLHMGIGLLETQTGSAAYRQAIGAYAAPNAWHAIYVRKNDTVPCAHFGAYATSNAGDVIQSSSLAVGNIVAAYPEVFRNGTATGTSATAATTVPDARTFFVFAANSLLAGSPVEHTNARLGWYSLGSTMTQSQVASFDAALVAFYAAIGRS
jgi:hypothetical protein